MGSDTSIRTLQNFLMQATGSDILRICLVKLLANGIKVCAPIHDAILIEVPLDKIEEQHNLARKIMEESGTLLFPNFRFRTESKIFKYPNYYVPEKGLSTWLEIKKEIGGTKNET